VKHTLLYWLSNIALVVAIVAVLSSCSNKEPRYSYGEYFCDAEKTEKQGNKTYFVKGKNRFKDGNLRSSDFAFAGKYSVKLTKKSPYGMGMVFENVKPGDYFLIRVWRKSKIGTGEIMLGSADPKFKLSTGTSTKPGENGWELLQLTATVPNGFKSGEVKIFLYNNDSEPAYFDNFKVKYAKGSPYSEYEGVSGINLDIPTESYQLLNSYRELAMSKGLITEEAKQYVPATFEFEGKKIAAQIRFKGDWLDHLQTDKWSFRIKIKEGSFKGMKSFSLQNPGARNFLSEWVIHKMLEREDLLTTRYGFIPLRINGKTFGIYAYEEHFDKQLLESSKRREGPILKFDESGFWERIEYLTSADTPPNQPFYQSADILPFKQKRTLKNPVLLQQFTIAQNLLYEHKFNLRTSSEIFDIKRLARFYAIMDVGQIGHGLRWHNMRYYYNPVISKLEPIGYDCTGDGATSHQRNSAILGHQKEDVTTLIERDAFLDFHPFEDPIFLEHYIKYLREFSAPDYMPKVMAELQPEIDRYEKLIQKEYNYTFDRAAYVNNAIAIGKVIEDYAKRVADNSIHFKFEDPIDYSNCNYEKLFPSIALKAFLEQKGEQYRIKLVNYHCSPLEIIGTKTAFSELKLSSPVTIEGYLKPGYTTAIRLDSLPKVIVYRNPQTNTLHEQPLLRWKSPDETTPGQELFSGILTIDNPVYSLDGNQFIFKPGVHRFTEHMTIPSGFQVQILAGTKLIFNNNSAFISKSPVTIKGTVAQPVIISSTDGTANGFTILQAEERSVLEHVQFKNFNTLNYKGWIHTGAVNFYESNVTIKHCSFSGNNCEDALNIIRSNFDIYECTVENTLSDGFDADFCTGTVTNSTFKNTGNDCIDFSGSTVVISGCVFENSGDKGISGGEQSTLTINNVKVSDAEIAVASKDLSVVTVDSIEVIRCQYGYASYRKKPEYGPGKITIKNAVETDVKQRIMIEEGSEIMLEGKSIIGTKKMNIDSLYNQI
jgi:hypothetical protein